MENESPQVEEEAVITSEETTPKSRLLGCLGNGLASLSIIGSVGTMVYITNDAMETARDEQERRHATEIELVQLRVADRALDSHIERENCPELEGKMRELFKDSTDFQRKLYRALLCPDPRAQEIESLRSETMSLYEQRIDLCYSSQETLREQVMSGLDVQLTTLGELTQCETEKNRVIVSFEECVQAVTTVADAAETAFENPALDECMALADEQSVLIERLEEDLYGPAQEEAQPRLRRWWQFWRPKLVQAAPVEPEISEEEAAGL